MLETPSTARGKLENIWLRKPLTLWDASSQHTRVSAQAVCDVNLTIIRVGRSRRLSEEWCRWGYSTLAQSHYNYRPSHQWLYVTDLNVFMFIQLSPPSSLLPSHAPCCLPLPPLLCLCIWRDKHTHNKKKNAGCKGWRDSACLKGLFHFNARQWQSVRRNSPDSPLPLSQRRQHSSPVVSDTREIAPLESVNAHKCWEGGKGKKRRGGGVEVKVVCMCAWGSVSIVVAFDLRLNGGGLQMELLSLPHRNCTPTHTAVNIWQILGVPL